MGRKTGGIDSHLDALKRAVLVWLEFEHADSLDPQARDAFYVRVQTEGLEKPPQPEPLAILYQMRSLGIQSYWSGGFSDQPYLWILEMQTCIEAETEFKRIQEHNLRARLEAMQKVVTDYGDQT